MRGSTQTLFNFAAISHITVLATESKLNRGSRGGVPDELRDPNFIDDHNVTESLVDELRLLSSTGAAKSVLQRALAAPKNQLFVIMSFGSAILDSAFEEVIKPLCDDFKIGCLRVDRIEDGGNVSQQILENIAQSRFVMSELTGERPNCYYESGFAHALGKEIIFSVRKGEAIHFDLSGYRFIQWETEGELRKKLRVRLESLLSRESRDA
jgi:hypothetical protein